jgi:hypothetical protein
MANPLKLANSLVQYMAIGQFGLTDPKQSSLQTAGVVGIALKSIGGNPVIIKKIGGNSVISAKIGGNSVNCR